MFSLKLKPISFAVMTVVAATSFAYAADAIKAEKVEIVSTTPLQGIGLTADKVPSNIQVVKGEKMQEQGSLTIADFMNANMLGVNALDTQGNPFQPDVTYHGFNASALLGSSQGLSIYQDGVRLNEPFGDVVSWDLIPMNAIKQMQLIPGTNPIYGLNTLGGAISLQTKRGRDVQGGAVELSAGSWGRKNGQVEYGGVGPNGLDYFVSGNYLNEDGWRDASPSFVRQMFGQLGWQNETTDLSFTMTLANNSLTGNGLMPSDMMQNLGREAVYTKPDNTANKMAFFNLTGSHWINEDTMLSGNAYFRKVNSDTLNGDINGDAEEQGSDAAILAFKNQCIAGTTLDHATDTGIANGKSPTSSTSTSRATIFGGPETFCQAVMNTSNTKKTGAGGTMQASFNQTLSGHANQFTVGAGYDFSRIKFNQNAKYGILDADRGVTALWDQEEVDGTNLKGRTNTWSLFATDTFSLNDQWHLTASGRYNHVNVVNTDLLADRKNEDESLSGNHTFSRLNPAIGVNYNPTSDMMIYASYKEGSRAPTSMELGCANAAVPCKLPTGMAGDPSLKQVVTRSFDLGARGVISDNVAWSLGGYHATNSDDLQFILANGSTTNNMGYFANVGDTQRVGLDAALSGNKGKFTWNASYSYVMATFEDSFTMASDHNRSKQTTDCNGNNLGLVTATNAYLVNGNITTGVAAGGLRKDQNYGQCVTAGDRMPGIPAHQLKVRLAYQATPKWNVGMNVIHFSDQFLFGNENNQFTATTANSSWQGNGKAPGYTVVNLDTRYKLTEEWSVFGKVNNIFDRDYMSGGVQGATMFDPNTNLYAGDDNRRSLWAPGAPRAAWFGVRYEFGNAKKSIVDKD